jgi:plasmid stability protein
LDDETYRQARIRAAEQNLSVSAVVKEFLTQGDLKQRTGVAAAARTALLKRLQKEPTIHIGKWAREELYEDQQ